MVIKPTIKIKVVDFWSKNGIAGEADFIKSCISKRFNIVYSDKPDFIIYSDFGKKYLTYDCKRIYFTMEAFTPDFLECDYAFSFDFPINERNYRLPFYYLYENYLEPAANRHKTPFNAESLLNRKFCSFMVSSDFGTDRNAFFEQLCQYKKVDSGGKLLNNIGSYVGRSHQEMVEFYSQYKFSLAFENRLYEGYTTEKMAQRFACNTLPIYWGNPLVAKDFNLKCFINAHDYADFDALMAKIIEIDNDDELYLSYFKEPIFDNGIDNEFINWGNISQRLDAIFLDKDKIFVDKKGVKKYLNWLKFIRLRIAKVLVSETKSGIVRIKRYFS